MRTNRWVVLSALLATITMISLAVGCGPAGGNGGNGAPAGNGPAGGGGDPAGNGDAGGTDALALTDAEQKECYQIYFDRCAGCHGALRVGATGPSLEPDKMTPKTDAYLKTIITNGTVKGMPEWGKSGILTDREIDLLVKYIQLPAPPPPEWSMADMKKSWKVVVPENQRPTAPPAGRNWQNYFGIILRDVGKVAIIDGDTKELLNIVETGFAVHILRTSASGRYFYSIGRDGKVTLIDLWMEKPAMVAEIKACNDARSIDTSKFEGFEDEYAVVGGYWPPALIVLNGKTLEPMKVVSTSSYTYDTNEFLREARVASIVSSHHNPNWVINIKETGQIWLVDYSNLGKGDGTLKVDMIEAERFLHDGGWDSSKRYFLVAANARDKVSVVDTKEMKFVANIPTDGTKPHPGRGANVIHPQFGPLWATGHIGSNDVVFIGTDPDNHPEYAWKVAKRINLPGEGGGNLFIKTHPNSGHIWADRPVHPELGDNVYVIDKETFEVIKTVTIPEKYRGMKAVHLEYNKDGTEMWVCVWGKKDTPSAILVYDDKTMELKTEITGDWVRTPTGHFNVYNTMKDIY